MHAPGLVGHARPCAAERCILVILFSLILSV